MKFNQDLPANYSIIVGGEKVFGVELDEETRCSHWNSDLDIIAIKFKCCGEWFSCFDCHEHLADHEAAVWPLNERDELALLCGECGHQLSISEYLESDSVCTKCEAPFNPNCARHYHLYFA